MQTGTVKWFNDAKGFGFITPDGGGEDLFAHFSESQGSGLKSLQENQKMRFEVKQGSKGHASRKYPTALRARLVHAALNDACFITRALRAPAYYI